MMKWFLAALVATLPAGANAAPVFLTCTLTDNDGPSQFDVQINEEAGTVSYFAHRTNVAVTKRAIFTPQAVTFNSFVISRTDLSFRRMNDAADVRLFGWAPADSGTCVRETSKRAF